MSELIAVSVVLICVVIGVAILSWRKFVKDRAQKVKANTGEQIQTLPNGNQLRNGRECLSESASKALDEQMDQEDSRFKGSKTW